MPIRTTCDQQSTDRQTEAEASTLDADTIFDVLSNGRRRYVLCHLLTSNEPITVRDLARDIAAWENGTEPEAVNPRQRKRVYTALHQTHLRRLDGFGVVEYDRNRGHVRPTELLEEAVGPLLDPSRPVEHPRPARYLVLGLVGAILGAATVLGLPLFDLLPPGTVALALAGGVVWVALRGEKIEDGGVESMPVGYVSTRAATGPPEESD